MQRNHYEFRLFPGFCGLSFKQLRDLARRPRNGPQPRPSSTTRSHHRSQKKTASRKSASLIQTDTCSFIETDSESDSTDSESESVLTTGQISESSSSENTSELLVCESLTSNCTSSNYDDELIIVHEESHPQVHARDTQRTKRLSSENYSVDKCFICQSGKKTKEAVTHPSQEAISKVLNLIADRIKFKDSKALTTCALLTESSPTAEDLEGAWCHRTCYREFGNVEQKNRAEKRYERALLTGEYKSIQPKYSDLLNSFNAKIQLLFNLIQFEMGGGLISFEILPLQMIQVLQIEVQASQKSQHLREKQVSIHQGHVDHCHLYQKVQGKPLSSLI